MSENHIIITEQPVYVNIPAIMGAQVFGRAGGKIQRLFTDSDQKVHKSYRLFVWRYCCA